MNRLWIPAPGIALVLFLWAGAGAAAPLEPALPGDVHMSCAELATEIDAMEIVMAETERARDHAKFARRGTGIAAAGISALTALTGGAALAVAGAGAAAEYATDNLKDEAIENAHNAELRRMGLVGLFRGKGCEDSGPPPPAPSGISPADIEPAAGGNPASAPPLPPRKPVIDNQ